MGQEPKHRQFSAEFRAEALRRLQGTRNVSELCRELGISRQLLHLWRKGAEKALEKGSVSPEQRRLRIENRALKKALVERTLEVDFLKAACAKVEALRQSATDSGATASGKSSAK
jgi:transposase-like protein